ncbi:pyruvate, phosphate dikinase [Novosphingobium rosa]|uniref:pyruvate, phosphate dikinase n=1 Tax=Novosphingobium rosa TaxID=76978 RepID=UPI00082DAE1F|nr:pyruvate, phosphate dikinase [Novosphingobium rosa]
MGEFVFHFGGGAQSADPRAQDKAVVGGKGANLAQMAAIGLPVPPGFTISTEICAHYAGGDRLIDDDLRTQVARGIAHLEAATGRLFGDPVTPLLVSVRSGAAVSMPGMMDTVLDLGLNDVTVEALAKASGDARFAWDSYRRFIQIYGDVALGVDHYLFEDALEIAKENNGFFTDVEMEAQHWRALVSEYKSIVEAETGAPFPQDVDAQLWGAIAAVFDSWESERARTYRRLNGISASLGTAVTVQAMVFGNRDEQSATGVAFTRDPTTGARQCFGEWLINAQGEDVVAGLRTPQYLTRAAREAAGAKPLSMEEAMPEAFTQLTGLFTTLETHFRDMLDIEFTVEQGRLWVLQARSGKRTAAAALRMASDMVSEGLITQDEALLRIEPMALAQLLHPTLDPDAPRDLLAKGLPASPGAASGAIVLDAETAERRAERGEAVILVRVETSPEDIHGMHAAVGILTARGGMTSHAAVVARSMGRPCVTGTAAISIDAAKRSLSIGGRQLREGDTITIDGTTGEVMAGSVPLTRSELVGDFAVLMGWADQVMAQTGRYLGVRANADTPAECRVARQFGAQGIGLCRTEPMFFQAERIEAMRRFILSPHETARQEALDRLLGWQRADFRAIFEDMAGLPVAIRLLDLPLHGFLPESDADMAALAESIGLSLDKLRRVAGGMHEFNPLLGLRGCRLGLAYPELYAMQARALFEAACEAAHVHDPVQLEVMVPLVTTAAELAQVSTQLQETALAVFAEKGVTLSWRAGAMIEVPRAALMAGELAREAAFFSFGSNDLTQTTLGMGRDDAARYMGRYVDRGIYGADPFITLDEAGVGALITLARDRGRAANPSLDLGLCGEHGADPASIAFCLEQGLDYVSASPYRVPVARLAAAQAALKAG